MQTYTIHDLMLIAGIDGQPRSVYVSYGEPPYGPNEAVLASSGDVVILEYDDGRDMRRISVEIP